MSDLASLNKGFAQIKQLNSMLAKAAKARGKPPKIRKRRKVKAPKLKGKSFKKAAHSIMNTFVVFASLSLKNDLRRRFKYQMIKLKDNVDKLKDALTKRVGKIGEEILTPKRADKEISDLKEEIVSCADLSLSIEYLIRLMDAIEYFNTKKETKPSFHARFLKDFYKLLIVNPEEAVFLLNEWAQSTKNPWLNKLNDYFQDPRISLETKIKRWKDIEKNTLTEIAHLLS